jgi:DNA-binding XRE family transcriptional regulator
MDADKRKRLEARGYVLVDAEEFLGLDEAERRAVELRVALIRALKARRSQLGLTQQELAARLKSSQSRIAKMEAGSAGISLDLMFRSLFALGGGLEDLQVDRLRP